MFRADLESPRHAGFPFTKGRNELAIVLSRYPWPVRVNEIGLNSNKIRVWPLPAVPADARLRTWLNNVPE